MSSQMDDKEVIEYLDVFLKQLKKYCGRSDLEVGIYTDQIDKLYYSVGVAADALKNKNEVEE